MIQAPASAAKTLVSLDAEGLPEPEPALAPVLHHPGERDDVGQPRGLQGIDDAGRARDSHEAPPMVSTGSPPVRTTPR